MKFNPDQVGMAARAVGAVDKVVDLPEPAAMLFSDTEGLESAFEQIKADGQSMISRLASLEPVNPGIVKLEGVIDQHFPGATEAGLHGVVQKAHQEYEDAQKAIGEIDSIAATAEFVALLAAAGALTPEGVTLPIAAGLAAKGGKELYDLYGRLKAANIQIEVVVDLANKLGEARIDFDRLWSEIDNEDSKLEATTEQAEEV